MSEAQLPRDLAEKLDEFVRRQLQELRVRRYEEARGLLLRVYTPDPDLVHCEELLRVTDSEGQHWVVLNLVVPQSTRLVLPRNTLIVTAYPVQVPVQQLRTSEGEGKVREVGEEQQSGEEQYITLTVVTLIAPAGTEVQVLSEKPLQD